MAKRNFQINEQQEHELRQAFEQERDGPTRTRFQAVRLYGLGYRVGDIQEITGCTRSSLMNWVRDYQPNGVAALADQRQGGNRAKLRLEQLQIVSERLREYTPRDLFGAETQTSSGQHWTVEDLARAVKQWFGVTWQSRTSYYTLFKHCEFTYQRTEKVFKSRRERDVAEFEAQLEKN
jgi:transposase